MVDTDPTKRQLLAWWELNEESGTRFDAHIGGYDLSDYNTVLFGAGKKGNAADFELDNSECLYRASEAALQLGDTDWTIGTWVKHESEPAATAIMGKYRTGNNTREYYLAYQQATDVFRLIVSSNGEGGGITGLDDTTNPDIGAWYYVVGYHDSVNNLLGISVNGSNYITTPHAGGIFQGSAIFMLGGRDSDGSNEPGLETDGLLDEAFIFNKVLSQDEVGWLYKSGTGRTYSELGLGFIPRTSGII